MPLLVAGDVNDLTAKITTYIEVAKAKAADGITFADLAELVLGAMRLAIAAVDTLSVPGAEKKTIVVQVAGTVFDALADRCIPLPLYPIWYVLRPAARSLCCSLAAGAVESLLPLVRLAT